jgi:gamma-aminobutyric acid type B receptor
LIGIGAIILYIDTFFFVIPSTDPTTVTVFCNLTPWLTAIGYSLCYGTILAKMARVYYIFNNPSTNKKVPKLDSLD